MGPTKSAQLLAGDLRVAMGICFFPTEAVDLTEAEEAAQRNDWGKEIFWGEGDTELRNKNDVPSKRSHESDGFCNCQHQIHNMK